ncbi:hypothetical protein H5410_012614 [Solanum commersonii]|uniref:Uncharacterized protein n=1 Tax=Solanum commersonii TaxID=4109 RepID=A0A9J6ASN8_SOLCO|nr:hypothetical protein H5410_012614 [Solanum commersonii]
MEIETVFLSCFSIEKKPDDIFSLIEAASKLFNKRKNRIIKFLMDPAIALADCILDDDEVEEVSSVGDEEKEEEIHAQSLMKKIEVAINKTVQVAPPKTKDNCNAITESLMESKKRSATTELVQQQLDDADKQGIPQSHNTTTMPSRKRMSNISTKSVGTPTQRSSVNAKSMPPPLPLMKMIVATKPKQSNCSLITRPMQKDTQSISNTKKIESSNSKFEERLAEQREAKRSIVMVDIHNMLKSANDSHAPKRCWDMRRF